MTSKIKSTKLIYYSNYCCFEGNIHFGVVVIIIISLFQEDNIFGTNASLTYGPRLQR